MQEPLVQHQRPVPGIQDHTLDIIGSQRHAEQLLHIREKSGHLRCRFPTSCGW